MPATLGPPGRPAPPLTARVVWCRTSSSERTSAYQSSIGIDTNTGPRGGSAAVCSARASACGTSWAHGGSQLHFTSGWGIRVASRLVRLACSVISDLYCCPAVTTSGVLLACALKIAPIPLPRPGAVWRLTSAGCPLAWAYPSAIPTATDSCRPRM